MGRKKPIRKKSSKKIEKKQEKSAPIESETPPSLADMLSQIIDRKDAEDVEKYTSAVLEKFGRYIKSIAMWGSKKTKVKSRKTSDIDIAIIVDDTDVRRMTRTELKDKLFQRLLEMGYPISKKIHPQPYLLTEFWQYVMEGNPVIYNVLRDGIIIFDSGYFMPLQMLMKTGNIRPSKETIDKHMNIADELIKLAESTMLSKMSYDFEQAVVSSAQAVLMELGYRPPTPNETAKFVQRVIVEEYKLADSKYTKIAEKVVKTYKDIEHKEKKVFSGKEYDEYLKDSKDFVEKMKKILKKLHKDKGESYLYEAAEAKKHGKKLELKRPTDIDLGKEDSGKNEEDIKKQLGQR